jgi:hypothetical protein
MIPLTFSITPKTALAPSALPMADAPDFADLIESLPDGVGRSDPPPVDPTVTDPVPPPPDQPQGATPATTFALPMQPLQDPLAEQGPMPPPTEVQGGALTAAERLFSAMEPRSAADSGPIGEATATGRAVQNRTAPADAMPTPADDGNKPSPSTRTDAVPVTTEPGTGPDLPADQRAVNAAIDVPSQQAGVTVRQGINLRSASHVQYFGEGVSRTDISGRTVTKAGWGAPVNMTAPLPHWRVEEAKGTWTAIFRPNVTDTTEWAARYKAADCAAVPAGAPA